MIVGAEGVGQFVEDCRGWEKAIEIDLRPEVTLIETKIGWETLYSYKL
jgi:hypothetical protein